MPRNTFHIPVLVQPLLTHFSLTATSCVIDGTLGFAGHASAILTKHPSISYVGFDKDPMAIRHATAQLAPFPNVTIHHAPFSTMFDWTRTHGVSPTHILLDLGVSSYQIDQSKRGFTFQQDEPLDMRMDPTQPLTATHILNTYSADQLTTLFKEEGDLRHPESFIQAILQDREATPYATTHQLIATIKRSVSSRSRSHFIANMTRIFQAIRVMVNQEMRELDHFLDQLRQYPHPITVAIITFQPNEDRRVKQFIRTHSFTPQPKKAIQASYNDCKKNPRERTAKLRIFSK